MRRRLARAYGRRRGVVLVCAILGLTAPASATEAHFGRAPSTARTADLDAANLQERATEGCTELVEQNLPGTRIWLAEPDLAPVARLLSEHRSTATPFPGLPSEATGPRTRIVLVRDLACLSELGFGSARPDWVAGVAYLTEGVIGLRVARAGASIPETAVVLRHELAHLALHRAAAGRAPRWLHEGYAQLAAGSWNWEEAWRLRWTFLAGSRAQLDGVSFRFPRDPAGAQLAYQLSYTAVREMWALAGERGFSAFVRALAEGASTDDAFRRVFGLTEAQFAGRWQRTIASRYGILHTLSRTAVFWAGISVLLIWAGLRRRKIRRERMAALVEADRREAARAAELGLDVDADLDHV
ncbi:MAG: hypothetical protein MJB57_12335 [Gemmatimonadetes bacterium]|nr:hypothetical protein [Gemmatimonadota bacterium]